MEKLDIFLIKIKSKLHLNQTLCYLLFFSVIVISVLLIVKIEKSGVLDSCEISDDWKIEYNNQKEVNSNIKEFKFDMANKGDYFLMKKRFKKDVFDKIIQPALCIEVRQSYVEIWVGKEKLFEKSASDGFIVSLPSDFLKKELTIKYSVERNNAFSILSGIYIVDEYAYVKSTIEKNFLSIGLAVFMLLFAILAIVIVAGNENKNSFLQRILLTGLFAFCISMWFISNNESFSIFLSSSTVRIVCEYYTLYYGVPILGMLVATFVEDKKNGIIIKVANYIVLTVAVVSTVLSLLDKSTIATYLVIIEAMGMMMIVFAIYAIGKDYNNKTRAEKILLCSFLELGLAIGAETIIYNVAYFRGEKYNSSLVIKYGLIIFLAVLIYAYFAYAKEYVDSDIEKNFLTEQVYKDVLTGLYNRSRVMDEIDMMVANKEIEYTIINFDLNDLKVINDTYGHSFGDKYLCIFSDLLEEKIGQDFEIIGRTGGDEFIAISKYYFKHEKLDNVIKSVQTSVERKCRANLKIETSFAYGFVSSNKNNPIEVMKAYEKADERMYECKKRQKSNKN